MFFFYTVGLQDTSSSNFEFSKFQLLQDFPRWTRKHGVTSAASSSIFPLNAVTLTVVRWVSLIAALFLSLFFSVSLYFFFYLNRVLIPSPSPTLSGTDARLFYPLTWSPTVQCIVHWTEVKHQRCWICGLYILYNFYGDGNDDDNYVDDGDDDEWL